MAEVQKTGEDWRVIEEEVNRMVGMVEYWGVEWVVFIGELSEDEGKLLEVVKRVLRE